MSTEELIEDFYKNNFNDLVAALSRRVGGVFNSEDVVQEAFCRALQYKDSFNPELGNLSKWLNTIVGNCLRDYLKTERYKGMSTVSYLEDVEEDSDEMAMFDGEKYLDNLKTLEEIKKEVLSVGEEYKQAFYLYFILGYRFGDIIKIADCPPRRVLEWAIYSFKKKLVAKYEDESI